MIFSKLLDCQDCGYSARAARELTFCPECLSDNILTMTNRQLKIRKSREIKSFAKVAEAIIKQDRAIESAISQLNHL